MKNIYFLGSSVTYGAASNGHSFVDEIGKRGFNVFKNAVSGTTLVDEGEESYIKRLKTIKCPFKPDAFVCQLSTNDATLNKPLRGNDVHSIEGAIKEIIRYVKNKYGCPIYFYTSPRYDSKHYEAMVELLSSLKDELGIGIINMWNDPCFDSNDKRYMADSIHPNKKGYVELWTPLFIKKIQGD